MAFYKRILVAIDIYSQYDQVLKRALGIAQNPTELHLVFVALPYTYFQPYCSGIGTDFVDEIQKQAKDRLGKVASKFSIPEHHIHIPVGDVAEEIQTVANQLQADLIVIGTHGRSGIKLLLGSTANAVLHGVKQDVLAVRMTDD